MSRARLQGWAEGGTSVLIGTVDADNIPTCCRAVAIATKDNFETITVYIPAATGQETVANVATTRRMAVSMSRPLTHETIQIKGISRGVRLAPPGDEEYVRERLDQFAEVLDAAGLPMRITRNIAHWPAFAVELSVEEVFDQTPGPKAGTPFA